MKKALCRWCRRMFLLALALVVGLLCLFGLAEGWTWFFAHSHCSPAVEDCPQDSVGLVLGCSKYFVKGKRSHYFNGRMEAAEKLWKSGRVRCLIVSGDNRHRSYNEPRDMKEELMRRGVPEESIICDVAGLRTFDSVWRASRVFGADKLAIVSQAEHAARAVSIARSLGMEAWGCEAPLAPLDAFSSCRQLVRERAARVAMLLDLLRGYEPEPADAPVSLPR